MASVRKRDPKNPNSPWVCEYTDASGARRRYTPKTGLKKDADVFRRKAEAEIERGEHTAAAESMPIARLGEVFLRHVEERVAERSVSGSRLMHYRTVIDNHLVPSIGAQVVASLDIRTAEKVHSDMTRRGLAPGTVRTYLSACVSIERFAKRRGFTKLDVFSEYINQRPKSERTKIRTFTVDQVVGLLARAAERPATYHRRYQAFQNCAVNVAAFCGLRRGEILGLTAENVDLHAGFIRVRHNLDRFDRLKGPKTKAGIRDIPAPAHVVEMLKDWIERYATREDRGLIFRNSCGGRFIGGNFNFNWRRLLDRAGLGDSDPELGQFHFHALRHFAASYMIECGWSLPEVASLLGHSTFDMTLQTYAHPVAGGRQRGHRMQALADRLLGSAPGSPEVSPPALALLSATHARQVVVSR